jgi:cytochrome c oxidase subunit 2
MRVRQVKQAGKHEGAQMHAQAGTPISNPARRRVLGRGLRAGMAGAGALLLGGIGLTAMRRVLAAPEEVRIKMTVKRFEFSQKELRVKKGVPVVVEITSEDVPHGFAVPEFHARAEVVMPGKPTEVRFVPDKVGQFQYLCDIFCGSKHEELEGLLIVEA